MDEFLLAIKILQKCMSKKIELVIHPDGSYYVGLESDDMNNYYGRFSTSEKVDELTCDIDYLPDAVKAWCEYQELDYKEIRSELVG
jgi:hypothetical protein